MATTKRSSGSSSGGDGRGASGGRGRAGPKLHSSHEVLREARSPRVARDASGPKPRLAARPKPVRDRELTEAARRIKSGGPARSAARGVGPTSSHTTPRVRKTKSSTPAAPNVASDSARELAVAIAIGALDKKAVGLEILDVSGRVDYADFLVIMTGRSDRQVQALAQAIEETLRKKGVRPLAVEGLPHANWVLMDFGDVVVHVFQDEARGLYDIEGLWLDARRIPVPVPDELR